MRVCARLKGGFEPEEWGFPVGPSRPLIHSRLGIFQAWGLEALLGKEKKKWGTQTFLSLPQREWVQGLSSFLFCRPRQLPSPPSPKAEKRPEWPPGGCFSQNSPKLCPPFSGPAHPEFDIISLL